jgi:hypothetical protein
MTQAGKADQVKALRVTAAVAAEAAAQISAAADTPDYSEIPAFCRDPNIKRGQGKVTPAPVPAKPPTATTAPALPAKAPSAPDLSSAKPAAAKPKGTSKPEKPKPDPKPRPAAKPPAAAKADKAAKKPAAATGQRSKFLPDGVDQPRGAFDADAIDWITPALKRKTGVLASEVKAHLKWNDKRVARYMRTVPPLMKLKVDTAKIEGGDLRYTVKT